MNARPVPALPPALNRALERVIGCLPTVSDREEPLESDMKQVRSLEAAILTALEAAEARERERHIELLRHVAEWARGRQKLADEESEQGGEEFSDIARRCEEKIRAPQDGAGETK